MKKSNNVKVQEFLDEVGELDAEKYEILQGLRSIVFNRYPKVGERMMYGGIMFSLDGDFGGIFVSKKHVSFEFGSGYKMTDPKGFLEGTGKFRRHLKIKTLSDIENKEVDYYVAQCTN